MKYLVMCEGPNEKKVIEMLIDAKKLKITRDDLLDRTVFFSRQIRKTPQIISALKTYNKPVIIWRIGDVLKNENFKIQREFSSIIDLTRIYMFCTKPEIEMLLIINENLVAGYKRTSSEIKPKDYAKTNVVYNNERYNNATKFWEKYYSKRIDILVENILEYKRIKNHKRKDEFYLADLLKMN